MFIAALPAILVCEEDHIRTSARRADHAIGPASRHHVLAAIVGVGEVYDRFLKPAGLVFHAPSMPENARLVNYIIAQFWVVRLLWI